MNRRRALGSLWAGAVAATAAGQEGTRRVAPLKKVTGTKARNVVFILADDHRYDALGFVKGQPFLETPHMDSLSRDGAHLKNAFVTTALCSPSRASILTGRYAHGHKIVDNNTPIPAGTTFFPQYLQQAGYSTAFIGKWHMGHEDDAPQPGFDFWASFRGQGSYLPSKNGLNVNGKRVPQKGYITDELTDYAIDWMQNRDRSKPYFLYLSHKAVHGDFIPPERYKGRYTDAKFVPPPTMAASGEMAQHRPMWVQNQRNSWHGVEYAYHSDVDISVYYKRYAETLLAVDDSVGRVLDELRKRGELDSTLVIYMGDNGFAFGEHGLIDKRTAYEESMRVPMLARCPELFSGGRVVNEVVANIDVMPTVLAAAGLESPAGLDGRNMLPVLQGKGERWRDELLYEYYWERNYPQTPTIHALRGNRYKFIRCHGIWDIDELYDLQEDPLEARNLIFSEQHTGIAKQMRERLFEVLEQTGGMNIPLYPDRGGTSNLRNPKGSKAAEFPPELVRPPVRR
ncbi:MAG: sulfatase [Bryobacteraceae bacterium]|nr:sulfatase [Bryobacteraceae bacterium]